MEFKPIIIYSTSSWWLAFNAEAAVEGRAADGCRCGYRHGRLLGAEAHEADHVHGGADGYTDADHGRAGVSA